MGDFKFNHAHSCETGVFVDRGQEDDQGNARKVRGWTQKEKNYNCFGGFLMAL